MKKVIDWLKNQRKINKIYIKKKNLSDLKNWDISDKEISHKTKNFFKIIGIRVSTNFNKKNWDQPIMVQNENGILGIITKKFKNKYKYLLQAKVEPGNINKLQLSPTVQATESNYKRIHGGKKTRFLNFFLNNKAIIKSRQYEQGFRYLNKFNTNYLIKIKKKIILPNNFRWFCKSELIFLMKHKNLLNMDTLSVFSCLVRKLKNEKTIHTNKEIYNWLKKLNYKYKIYYKKINLVDIKNWKIKKDAITNKHLRHFSVIGLNVRSNSREVRNWDQPIIAGKKGFAGFIVKNFNETKHYLCKFVLKPGLKGGKISCSVNFSDINDYKKNPNIPSYEKKIIKYFFGKKRKLYNNTHSDEGGRFYHTQIKRVVIESDNKIDKKLNSNFIWISHNQFLELIKKKIVDIEARILFTCYNFNNTL